MLTEEQIKSLKKGDKVLAELSFIGIAKDNDLACKIPITDVTGDVVDSGYVFHPSCLTLPPNKPKYDPCRLFKKGDVVTPSSFWGRKDKELEMGEKYIVTADEIAGDMVAIKHHFTLRPDIVQPCFLELVTPAGEGEPYSVETDQYGFYIERYDGKILATYNDDTHPNAYEAAEAECERLNDEWRKEHE